MKSTLVLAIGTLLLTACQRTEPTQQVEAVLPPEPALSSAATRLAPGSRPNILLIVADDLGYQDLSVFGGEIATPNIDALFQSGVMMTQFYASVACQPTRAMLMSGTDHHLAGVGSQGRVVEGSPAYQNRLTQNVASVAERLAALDYHTSMIGKWHLGLAEGEAPADRGFERSFVLLEPGAFHFDMRGYSAPEGVHYEDDGVPVDALPADFYSTIAYTDHMIGFIEEASAADRPFFFLCRLHRAALADPGARRRHGEGARPLRRRLRRHPRAALRAHEAARPDSRGCARAAARGRPHTLERTQCRAAGAGNRRHGSLCRDGRTA